ncbi:MAG TPA: flotillin family protein, partial [Acidimicrobiales bacterium]|nr:flotillin family protein [Acidimicrobiales bacterium]
YRVVFGGRAWRVPVIEQVQRMDVRAIPIDVAVQGAYTRVGIPLKVRAIALVKISSNPEVVTNAIERFLGRGLNDVQQVAKETLEGNLRGVLATLTPEEVNEDRLKFAESLSQEVEHDLAKLGLHLDVLKIQHVTDDAKYLDSIGRGKIAQVIQEAEIAESNARNEAAKESAAADMRAKVAEADAERAIAQKRNEARRVAAELEAEAKGAEERAEAGALAAQAQAMQALEAVRRELEAVRLQADVVIPAEIQRESAALASAGAAASIAENGRATAESLSLVADAWTKAGPSATDMFLINKIEDITQIVVDGVRRIQLGPVDLIDGGDGQALPRLAAAYPTAVAEVLRSLFETTGVDITALLAQKVKNGA